MILQFPEQKTREAAAKEDARTAILELRREVEIKSRLPFVGPPGLPNRHGFAKQNFGIDEPTDDGHALSARKVLRTNDNRCDTGAHE